MSDPSDKRSHRVTVRPTGKTFDVPAGRTVLDAALESGLNLPHSCRGGNCGACLAALLDGVVHYRNDIRPPGLTIEDEANGLALLCQAEAGTDLIIETRELESAGLAEVRRMPCRVVDMERVVDDVMIVHLQLPKAEPFEFLAGQYVDILLSPGHRRSFSIANAPDGSSVIELHVRRVGGGEFTNRVFDELKPKSLLRIEGPLGNFFWRHDHRRPILMMAGGTGFAPIKAILTQMFSEKHQGLVHFFWGARHRHDLYESGLVEAWDRDHSNFYFTPVLSEASEDDEWSGEVGWVHEALLRAYPDLSAYDVYACGPPPMIDAAQERFAQFGLIRDQFFFDSFEFAAETQRRLRAAEERKRFRGLRS